MQFVEETKSTGSASSEMTVARPEDSSDLKRSVRVATNYFPIVPRDSCQIQKHIIEFTPSLSTSPEDKEIALEVLEKIGRDPLTEAFGIYVIKEFFVFSSERVEESLELSAEISTGRTYTLRFRHEDSLPMTHEEVKPYYKSILDIIVTRKSILRCSGTDWFCSDPKPEVREVGMYQAFFCTIKSNNDNLSLIVNPKSKFMQKEHIANELYNGTISESDLEGAKVITTYNKSNSY